MVWPGLSGPACQWGFRRGISERGATNVRLNQGDISMSIRTCLVAMSALIVASSSWALAAGEPSGLERSAIEKLNAGNFEAALVDAQAAAAEMPDSGRAHFLRGMLLNRTGKPVAALRAFSTANDLGYKHDHALFEIGWASLNAGLKQEAIIALETYETQHPGNAKTSEFLGRAYMQLGQYQKAESKFKQALERDKDVTPTVNVYMAVIAKIRGQQEESMKYLRSTVDDYPQSPISETLKETMRQAELASYPSEKRWRLTLSSGAGYNDNVYALNEDTPVPMGAVGDNEGFFFRNTVHGAFDVLRDEKQILTLGYAFQSDIYASSDFDAVDYMDHYWYGEYYRRLTGKLAVGARVSDDYSLFDGEAFRNRAAISPSLFYQASRQVGFELAYTFRNDEHYFMTTPLLDRDAVAHIIDGAVHYQSAKRPYRTEIGFQYMRNNADGPDFDHESFTVYGTVEAALPLGLGGELTYAYTHADYENLNSFVGFGATRKDDTHFVRVQLTKPIALHDKVRARIYVRYEHVGNSSNVFAYQYDQNVISSGLIIDF